MVKNLNIQAFTLEKIKFQSMKRYPPLSIFLLIILQLFVISASAQAKKSIALINPGHYLYSVYYLIQQGIIDTGKVNFEAVFYSEGEIKKEDAISFINEKRIKNISVKEIIGNLTIDNIYKHNSCSDQFLNVFKESDGIIFFGGDDIPPSFYGAKTEISVGINTPKRHLFELSFLFHLLGGNQDPSFSAFLETKPYYTVLGICLGLQTMNVATGGDMFQDIPSDIYHLNYIEDIVSQGDDFMHRNYNINLYPNKNIGGHAYHHILINDIAFLKEFNLDPKSNPLTVSSHHQAVKNIGKNLKISGTSMDGKVVEILTHEKYKNVIGVQFHPEFYTLYDKEGKGSLKEINDNQPKNEYQVLVENGSYDFHVNFWKKMIEKVTKSGKQ